MSHSRSHRSAPKVLLVDDEPNVLAAMRRALRRAPFQILTANSGSEALSILEREPIDAIVSDQDMPEMKGVDLFSIVCRLHPTTVRFMLTGRATLDVAMNAINKGSIQRFFTKPMDPAVLVVSLEEALAQKALFEEAWRLLHKTREQAAVLDALELEQPGITRLQHDSSGAIVLDEPPQSLEELLAEISSTLSQR